MSKINKTFKKNDVLKASELNEIVSAHNEGDEKVTQLSQDIEDLERKVGDKVVLENNFVLNGRVFVDGYVDEHGIPHLTTATYNEDNEYITVK